MTALPRAALEPEVESCFPRAPLGPSDELPSVDVSNMLYFALVSNYF